MYVTRGLNPPSAGLPFQTIRQKEQCRCEPISITSFFADAPWLSIPLERQGEILIEPLYPRGGLLGGSSNQGGPKVSKLAALAAARKKKENEKQGGIESQQSNSSVVLLERLKDKDPSIKPTEGIGLSPSQEHAASTPIKEPSTLRSRKYPIRRRRSSHDETSATDIKKAPASPTGATEDHAEMSNVQPLPMAAPSTFARTMIGPQQGPQTSFVETPQMLTLPVPSSFGSSTKKDPFAGPSPDDIVTKAQTSSKGSTHKS